MHSTGCFLGHCLIKLPPIACQPSEQIGESLSHILCHFLFQRALMGVTPVQRDDKGKCGTFCYSCVQTSGYFRTAFFCPADLLREHLCSHHSLSPTPLLPPPSTVSPQRCLAFSLSVAKHKGTVILGLLVTIATAFSTLASPFPFPDALPSSGPSGSRDILP